jgi:hypothetical protein
MEMRSIRLPDRVGRISPAGARSLHGNSMNPSIRMIIDLNVKHYLELFKTEPDARKREAIMKLLAEEEQKLAKLADNKPR